MVADGMAVDERRPLMLFSRQGCCLCEGLEQRLRQLDLSRLGLDLQVIDIDAAQTPSDWKTRYDLEVPVLTVGEKELPRVSPRLSADGLMSWLKRKLDDLD